MKEKMEMKINIKVCIQMQIEVASDIDGIELLSLHVNTSQVEIECCFGLNQDIKKWSMNESCCSFEDNDV